MNLQNEQPLLNERTSNILNLIRGLSAVLVVLNHFVNLFFAGFDANSSLLIIFLYALSSLGHQAVVVFFVLSGVFIANSVLKSIYNNKWSWKHYMINRLTRLYVVLIPALFIGLMLDKVGMTFFDYSFYPHDMSERTSVGSFLGNLFFLQGIYTEQFGSNDPLWSLSYEFWFYILFPIAVIIVSSKDVLTRMIGFLAFIAVLIFIGQKMSIYFIVWLCGVLLLFMPRLTTRSKLVRLLTICFVLITFMMSILLVRFHTVHPIVGDLILAVSFTLLLWVVLNSKINLANSLSKLSKVLADFSYTLYLVHFPVIIFISALFRHFGFSKFSNDLPSLIKAIVLLLMIIGFSYAVSMLTEAKTSKVRHYIYKHHLNKESRKKVMTESL